VGVWFGGVGGGGFLGGGWVGGGVWGVGCGGVGGGGVLGGGSRYSEQLILGFFPNLVGVGLFRKLPNPWFSPKAIVFIFSLSAPLRCYHAFLKPSVLKPLSLHQSRVLFSLYPFFRPPALDVCSPKFFFPLLFPILLC